MKRTILFLCPHGAAKSVIAKAYFNQFAQQQGLPFVADSAGTEPDAIVSATAVNLLAESGIDVSSHVPRHVTENDLQSAERIISMGCTPQELNMDAMQLEIWDDIPMVSQQPAHARDVIRSHVEKLISQLKI